MKSPASKTAQSPAKTLLGFAASANAQLRSLFITRPARRARTNVCFGHHSLAGLQPLEPRLVLTPVAVADSYYGNAWGTTTIPAAQGVLANDSGSNLTAVLVSQPYFGTLTLNSNGSFTYRNTSQSPGDSFSYKDYDGTNYSNTVNVSLQLSSNGAAPSAAGDSNVTIAHDRTLDMAAPGVLGNDRDPNHLPITAVIETQPAHGTATLSADGELVYTPAYHYTGSDSLTYEDYNGYQYSNAATVSISVTNHAPVAENDQYGLPNGQTFTTTSANGVLANDRDADGDTLTASLLSQPNHGSLTFNSDGSFSYTPVTGWVGQDSFTYQDSDGIATSNTAAVTLQTQYSVLSASDETKAPVDTIHVGQQILSDPFGDQAITSPLPAGGSGGTTISAVPADGAAATAHNLSLVYDSVLAQPDQVIEADLGLSTSLAASETVTATLTFNGVAQSLVYYTMQSLNGTTSHVHFAEQVDTSSLASGRYPWSLTVTSPDMAAPATLSGYVNVVNDSASPFGTGWDMPGLYRLFQNNVSGVPAGVLLSTGDGGSWYYTQNEDGSFTSPNGPFAFSTLTAVSGGGWQLLTHEGITFNFNSGGYLTSRVERTSETTSYTWSSGELTAITDPFSRAVDLSYSSGLLSSIQDFASSTWTIAHTGTNLVSITQPDPGNGLGAPVWQYAYSGNYMSSVVDPNSNQSSFVLDSFHRLSQTDLSGGASAGDTSEQDFGYGSTNSSSPANLTLATSVTPTSTDANGNQLGYQTNAFGEPVSEVDPYGNVETIQRDANGLPTVITLPPPATGDASPVTDLNHPTSGDLTSATGAQPTYGTYTYTADSFGQWATFTDISGKEWVRTFDSRGDILSEQDPSGATVSWTFDTYGRPLTMTMPAPNDAVGTVTVAYHYDSEERLTEIVWPDNTNEQFGYNADDIETSYQDENGHQTLTGVDVLGRVVSVTAADSGVTSTAYDRDGNVLTTETPLDEVTSNVWNSRNELVEQDLPSPDGISAGPVLTYTYSATGQELTESDGLGRTTTRKYDKLDRLTEIDLPDPDGSGPLTSPVTTIGYNNLSQKIFQTTALGTTTWAYANTDISQLTSEALPPPSGSGTGPTTSYFYDADGRQNQVENALSQYTTTTFTVNGQVASVEDNLGDTTSESYGNGGELLSTTDPLNHTQSDEYDLRYRLIETQDANSGVTQITLDGVGNTVALVDSDNNQTTWTYSPTNLPLTETNALGTTTTTFNLDHETTSIEGADGRVRDFVYNNDQQLTAENWMSGSTIVATMAYSYDLGGELTSASDPNSAYAFTYNGDGQTTSVDNAGTPNIPHVILTASYDPVGDMLTQSATINGTADFANSYTYNDDQRLTMVQQQGVNGGDVVSPKEIDYGYNAIGQFSSVADFNYLGVGPREDILTGAYSYDNGSRLMGLAYTSSGGTNTIDTFGWTYNAGNLVTSFSSVDGTASYGYDPTNQLTSASYTTASGGHQPANESYSYTANGNRDSAGYSTGSDNLISSDGTFNYTHDAIGNTTVRTRISSNYATDYRTTFTWDYRNRLTDVEFYDNNGLLTKHAHFVYDVFDNLIGEQDDDTGNGTYDDQQFYVVTAFPESPDAGQPSAEAAEPLLQFDGAGNLTKRYLVAPSPAGIYAVVAQGSVSSLTQGDVVTWMADDNEGTPRDEVDNNGTLVNHRVFSSFGQDVYDSNPAVTHWASFAGGHVSAATGFENEDERWLNLPDGDWLSQDPIRFHGGDANISRYVRNGPTNGVDPTGLIDPGGGPQNPPLQPQQSPPINTPNGQWTWAQWALWQTALSSPQVVYAQQKGCYGLMLGLINAPQLSAQYPKPYLLPGMTMFGSYNAANQYSQQNPGSSVIAYQFQYGANNSTTPWTPPSAGALQTNQLPQQAGNFNAGNWCTLQNGSKGSYWTYMNYGIISAQMLGKPQMVYNVPLNTASPTAGIPAGVGYNTTIFGVYVPPPPPPPWWAMIPFGISNYFQSYIQSQGPITPPGM